MEQLKDFVTNMRPAKAYGLFALSILLCIICLGGAGYMTMISNRQRIMTADEWNLIHDILYHVGVFVMAIGTIFIFSHVQYNQPKK